MLYPYQLISEDRFSLSPEMASRPPLTCVLELCTLMNQLFDEQPVLLRLRESRTMTLLYRNVVYTPQDLMDSVGALAAQVSRAMPVCFYGTTDRRETAELTIRALDEQTAIMRQYAVSGHDAGQLRGLGIHLELPDGETQQYLIDMLSALANGSAMMGAMPQKYRQLLEEGGLLLPTEGTLFAYFSWNSKTEPGSLLYTLTVENKMRLWQSFLEDHQQPAEFDWIWNRYYTESSNYLLEWELALRMVLEKLRFQVQRGQNHFRLTDASGQELRFDFTRGGAAEKLFLKLLFPVDAR